MFPITSRRVLIVKVWDSNPWCWSRHLTQFSHLIVNFDRLDVLPLLNGLGQVHHAQWYLHLTDLKCNTVVHTVLDENKSSQREHTVCAHYMAWEHGANNRKSFISLINLLSFSNMTSDEKWSIYIYIYIYSIYLVEKTVTDLKPCVHSSYYLDLT